MNKPIAIAVLFLMALSHAGCVTSAPRAPVGVDAVVPATSAPVGRGRLAIHVNWPEDAESSRLGLRRVVRTGVPFSRGELRDASAVRLRGADGADVPCQTKVLSTWNGSGSIKFLLLTFEATAGAKGPYALEFGRQVRMPRYEGLRVLDGPREVVIETGSRVITIARDGGAIISAVSDARSGRSLLAPGGVIEGYFVGADGSRYVTGAHERRVVVEESGPVAAVVRVSGWYQNAAGEPLNQYIVRVYAYAGSAGGAVRLIHTFVNTGECDEHQYREIALSVPWLVEGRPAVRFELDGGEVELGPSALVQAQTSVARVVSGGVVVVQGKRAGNSVRVRGNAGNASTAVAAVRWLWQQHPCSLEVGADGSLAVQFWSPQQSRLFDLRPRGFLENLKPGAYEEYRRQTRAQAHAKYQVLPEDGGELELSGQGMGKTHEVMLAFGADEQEARDLALFTEHPPFAYPDPAYACATNVREPMHPRDDSRFPAVEKLIDDHMRGFYEMRDWPSPFSDGYGYFNFGDTLHGNGQHFHRFWSHQFYCGPASYWVLYFRSGDRLVREFADANARHVMELDTGHYDGPGTIAGAMVYEDNGVFHHYACEPGKGYTNIAPNTSNIAEYLCLMHQMTGDERARDVIDEVRGAMIGQWRRGKPGWSHRATGYSLKNTLELYEITWDPMLRQIADYYAQQVLANTRDGVSTGYDGQTPADFTLSYIFPGAIHYLRLTGDEAMAQFIVSNARFVLDAGLAGPGGGFNNWDGLVCAYRLTGDRDFAQAAYLALMGWTRDYDPTGWIGKAWGLYKAPIVLDVAARERDLPQRAQILQASSTTEVALLDKDDQPMRISVIVDGPHRAPAFEQVKQWQDTPRIVLLAPDGSVIDEQPHPAPGYDRWYTRRAWLRTFDVPADNRTGVYRVQLRGMPEPLPDDQPMEHDKCPIPAQIIVRAQGAGGAMGRMAGDGLPPTGRYGKGVFHFHVPTNTQSFRISVQSNNVTQAAELVLRDPDGAVADQADVPAQGQYVLNWFSVQATPDAQQRGRTWSIEIDRFNEYYRMKFEGVPAYLARERDAAFDAAMP